MWTFSLPRVRRNPSSLNLVEAQAIVLRKFFGMARRGVPRQVFGTCPQPEVTEIESSWR